MKLVCSVHEEQSDFNVDKRRFSAILYRSICISWHLQLRTGGFFVGLKLYCPHALGDGNQHIWIMKKMLEFSTVLSMLSPYL